MIDILLYASMFIALTSAYNAGKLRAAIDTKMMLQEKIERQLYIFWFCNILVAMYFIMAVYGHGLAKGNGV